MSDETEKMRGTMSDETEKAGGTDGNESCEACESAPINPRSYVLIAKAVAKAVAAQQAGAWHEYTNDTVLWRDFTKRPEFRVGVEVEMEASDRYPNERRRFTIGDYDDGGFRVYDRVTTGHGIEEPSYFARVIRWRDLRAAALAVLGEE